MGEWVGGSGGMSLIQHLNSTIKPVDASHSQDVRKLFWSAQLLLNQADAYRKANNEAQLYVMLMRYSSLIVETIPKHTKYNPGDATFKKLKKILIISCFPELEGLKINLSTRQLEESRKKPVKHQATIPIGTSLVPEIDWGEAFIPSVDNGSLLDALPSQSTTPQMAPPPLFNTQLSRSAKGASLEKHGLFTPPSADRQNTSVNTEVVAPGVSYPLVDAPSLMDAEPPVNCIVNPPQEIQLGPQELEVQRVSPPSGPLEPHHDDCTCSVPAPPPTQTIVEATSPPKYGGLRELHISYELLQLFLRRVESNTRKGTESCGVLAGELGGEEGVLRVNRLILPPQKGSRDQVEMLNEEVLLEETMLKGFIVMGWIHTHPEFDCFLSSIDVHTTLSYQLLLEEAVAIVMAPKDRKRKCGVFRLSTPGGLDLVKGCKQRGFHQHGRTKTGQDVYEVSSHVYLNPDLEVVVSDRRNG